MTRSMKRHTILPLQGSGTIEPENRASVPLAKESKDIEDDKAIANMVSQTLNRRK